jgi:hypothetical protein
VTHWFWVASGKVDFLPLDKAKIRLDNEDITFIGKTLQAKHLPRAGSTTRHAAASSPLRLRGLVRLRHDLLRRATDRW